MGIKMPRMKLPDWLNEARGRKSALAARLGVPASFIIKIAVGEKKVPLDHCPAIQEFTGGAVTCEELRPDMVEFFAMVRQQSATHGQKQPPALSNAAHGAMESVASQGA